MAKQELTLRAPITQEAEYGCGVACFAFVCDLSYKNAVLELGREYSVKHGWKPNDLVKALNDFGLNYKNRYITLGTNITDFTEGTIILIRRSAGYPVGHYLVRHKDVWMDPWVNISDSWDLKLAYSGYRDSLPGLPMYALTPYT